METTPRPTIHLRDATPAEAVAGDHVCIICGASLTRPLYVAGDLYGTIGADCYATLTGTTTARVRTAARRREEAARRVEADARSAASFARFEAFQAWALAAAGVDDYTAALEALGGYGEAKARYRSEAA